MRESLFWMSVVQTVLFLVTLCVSLTPSIAVSPPKPQTSLQFSHYFIIIVFRKTLAVLLELCCEFQEVAQVSGSDHVSFVFKGRMKDLERNSRVLGIWLGSLVNLNTWYKSSLDLETVGSLFVLSAARRVAVRYPGKRLGQSAQKMLWMKTFQAQERLLDENQGFLQEAVRNAVSISNLPWVCVVMNRSTE